MGGIYAHANMVPSDTSFYSYVHPIHNSSIHSFVYPQSVAKLLIVMKEDHMQKYETNFGPKIKGD